MGHIWLILAFLHHWHFSEYIVGQCTAQLIKPWTELCFCRRPRISYPIGDRQWSLYIRSSKSNLGHDCMWSQPTCQSKQTFFCQAGGIGSWNSNNKRFRVCSASRRCYWSSKSEKIGCPIVKRNGWNCQTKATYISQKFKCTGEKECLHKLQTDLFLIKVFLFIFILTYAHIFRLKLQLHPQFA